MYMDFFILKCCQHITILFSVYQVVFRENQKTTLQQFSGLQVDCGGAEFCFTGYQNPLLIDDSGQWFQTSLLPFRFPCKSAGADSLHSSSLQLRCTGWFGGMSICFKEHWYTGCFQPLVRVREGKLVSQRCTASWWSRSHDLLNTKLLVYFLSFQSFPATHEAGSKSFRV